MLNTSTDSSCRLTTRIQMKCRAALAVFLIAGIGTTHAQTNWVSGTAYGTNDLANATSISSVDDGSGSLVIGFPNTTNLSLNHDIQGFIVVTNQAGGFTVASTTNAVITSSEGAALTAINATNMTITGGRFIGTTGPGSGIFPPLDGIDGVDAVGGLLRNSTATLSDSTFTGSDGQPGLVLDASAATISNGVFIGGGGSIGGPGLLAVSNSTVTIHDGSVTGRVGNTAFYLQNSDAIVHGGSFTGNAGGVSGAVYGDGLFSEMTAASTNQVELHGGTFSSLAFWGVDGSVQLFLAGTNLVVQNGIVQSNGTVIVDNQSDLALQDITILNGLMLMQNDFTLSSNGVINLVSADAQLAFSGDFMLGTATALSNGLGRVDVSGDVTMDVGSDLYVIIDADTNGVLTANTVTFESNATVHIDATQAGFSSGTNTVEFIVTAAGVSGTNHLNVDADTIGRIIYSGLELIGGNNLAASFTAQALKDYWNATGQLALLADELEAIGSDEMLTAIDAFDDPEQSSAAVEQTYFTTFNNFQAALQGMRAAVGQSQSRGSEFREQIKLMPAGARGPVRNNSLRGWAKYYGHYYTHDRDQLNPEYDMTLHGGTVGLDTSFGDLLVGVSGGSSRYRITHDPKARSDTVAYHGNIYATHGFERGYLDAGIFYGQNQIDTRTADPFRLDGSFDADMTGGYLGGGYDLIDVGGATIFTPEASVQYAMYEQDAYTESGTAAIPRVIEGFDADSLLSSLGMNISMLSAKKQDTYGYKADLRLHWMHEFNPDPSDIGFVLQGGGNTYSLAYPALDEDLFRIGIGAAFFNTLPHQPKNVMLRIDFDELFGDGFNSHNLSAKVVYAF